MPQIATTDAQIEHCFGVMAELRPQLRRDEFVGLVRRMQAEGYQLAYLERDGDVVSVAGYRIQTNFFMGRHLYVEDLVTAAAARGQGHGATMLDWLMQQARAAGCAFFDLDSGPQRGRAHKFYFTHGLSIVAYHFATSMDV